MICKKGHRYLITKAVHAFDTVEYDFYSNLERQCQDCLERQHTVRVPKSTLTDYAEGQWPFIDGLIWSEGRLPKELSW